MNKYGVEDLLRHIIYVNEEKELDPLNQYSIHRVLFMVLGMCYNRGIDITYDLMFEKSSTGARVRHLDERDYSKWRYVNFEEGLAISELANNEDMNESIVNIIQLASTTGHHQIANTIKSSEAYQRDADEIQRVTEEKDFVKLYPYWTKTDIAEMFDAAGNIDRRSSIPVMDYEYEAIVKFMRYKGNWGSDVPFTREEFRLLHGIPFHKLLQYEKFGIHVM